MIPGEKFPRSLTLSRDKLCFLTLHVCFVRATRHSIDFKRLEFDRDNVPFSKQINETVHCNVLFGPHGAGFGHLIWMESGVRVIEIGGETGCESYYRAMSLWYGHYYTCFSDIYGHEIKISGKEVYESLNITLLVNVIDGAVAALTFID